MRYLRLFEEKTDFYSKYLSIDEFMENVYGKSRSSHAFLPGYMTKLEIEYEKNYINNTWENFTNSEIDKIKSLLNEDEGLIIESPSTIDENHHKIDLKGCYRQSLRVYILRKPKNHGYIYIYKLQDEWYYLQNQTKNNRKFYKCDGFEELIKYLSNLI